MGVSRYGLLGCGVVYLANRYKHFGGTCGLHLQDRGEGDIGNGDSRFLQNFGTHLPKTA
jgi:hypothetical protein